MPASREQAIKNLKGKTGAKANPNGRPPKGYSITEWFQNMLNSDPKVKDELGQAILAKAKAGDPTALKLVWNYMDGLPKQAVDVNSSGTLEVKWKNAD
jgi:hypothetical protein